MATVTRGLLDTSVLIDLLLVPAERLPDESAISVVSLAELHYGVLMARTPAARLERTRFLQEIESGYHPLPIDEEAARTYGLLAHAIRTRGRNPRTRSMDLLIAATAKSNGLSLFTRNPDDFRGLAAFVDIRGV